MNGFFLSIVVALFFPSLWGFPNGSSFHVGTSQPTHSSPWKPNRIWIHKTTFASWTCCTPSAPLSLLDGERTAEQGVLDWISQSGGPRPIEDSTFESEIPEFVVGSVAVEFCSQPSPTKSPFSLPTMTFPEVCLCAEYETNLIPSGRLILAIEGDEERF